MRSIQWVGVAAGTILAVLMTACASFSTAGSSYTDMVLVPAGQFLMGADQVPPDDASPQYEPTLPTFWIDKYEVTNAQYRQCVDASACNEPKDLRYYQHAYYADHPVVYVTWYNARDYCTWRSKRLPTEAEWEKAARGSQGWIYPWGEQNLGDRLNADNRIGGTQPVGGKLSKRCQPLWSIRYGWQCLGVGG